MFPPERAAQGIILYFVVSKRRCQGCFCCACANSPTNAHALASVGADAAEVFSRGGGASFLRAGSLEDLSSFSGWRLPVSGGVASREVGGGFDANSGQLKVGEASLLPRARLGIELTVFMFSASHFLFWAFWVSIYFGRWPLVSGGGILACFFLFLDDMRAEIAAAAAARCSCRTHSYLRLQLYVGDSGFSSLSSLSSCVGGGHTSL